LSTVVGILRHGERPLLNLNGGPVVSGGESSEWKILSGGGIVEFKQPGGRSRDFGVDFQGEGSDELEVSLVDGRVEVEESQIGEVSSRRSRDEVDVRVGVSLESLLVGITKGAVSSDGDLSGSIDGLRVIRNGSASGGKERVDLSSQISLGSGNLEISESGRDGVEVAGDGNSSEKRHRGMFRREWRWPKWLRWKKNQQVRGK